MNENTPVPPTDGTGTPAPVDPATEERFVARLRAADPAATVMPDSAALRAAVDRRLAHGGSDELAAARARRWTSWPARVAGVAAAALLVGGGGGYAIGAAGVGDDGGAREAITLSSGQPTTGFGGPESATMESDGLGGADAARGGAMDSSYWPGYGGRTVFTSSGLSEDGGSAPAWTFDPEQAFTEATITSFASALGVTGPAQLLDGYWVVGPVDGSGPNVSLYRDGTTSVNYYDPTKDPWVCDQVMPQEGPAEREAVPDEAPAEEVAPDADVAEGGGTDASTSMPAPEPCEQRDIGTAPQGDAALAAARDVLGSVGLDAGAFELTTENWGDPTWTYVTAHQVVEGQKTGLAWNLSFTGAGLQSLYGHLAPLVSLGDYEVISPTEAVDRLTDPRFGGGWGGPIAFLEGAEPAGGDLATSSDGAGVAPVPTAVEPGGRISWPVAEVTIVDSRLGSAMHYQADGGVLLVPTYELIGADGGIWSVIAVADAHLDFSAGR